MSRRDKFDDPFPGETVRGIFSALDQRDAVAARKPLWATTLLMALIAIVAGVIWYSYPREKAQQELITTPIIRAEAGPVKIEPDDPGGMDVPFRDSTIFGSIREDGPDSRADSRPDNRKVENLLADAETPLDKDKLFAGLKTPVPEAAEDNPGENKPGENNIDGKIADTNQGAGAPITPRKEVAAQDVAETPAIEDKTDNSEIAVASGDEESRAPLPGAKPEPDMSQKAATANRTEPAAGPARRAAKPPAGDHFVQLASLRSPENAKQAWKDMKTRFPDAFGGLDFRIQKAEIAGRGTYYRVQAGPLAKEAARDLCATIEQKRAGGCLVIRP